MKTFLKSVCLRVICFFFELKGSSLLLGSLI